MSRRRQATRRTVAKDGKFQSALVARLVNTIMQGGKKVDAPPVVPVAKPIQRTVTDYVDYAGRTSAKASVVTTLAAVIWLGDRLARGPLPGVMIAARRSQLRFKAL